LESIHETDLEDEIRHKAIQTALLSFLINLFSTNISTLGANFIIKINAVGYEFGVSAFVEVHIGSGGRA
jgi:hypothetical protein